MEIFAVKIREISHKEMDKLCEFLSEEKRIKIIKYHMDEDKLRALVGEALIRNLVCKKLGVKNSSIRILKNEYGKPYLDEYRNIHFNISHSGEYVVVIVDHQSVGIDIEHIRPIDYSLFAEDYFSTEELMYLAKEKQEASRSRFYEIWTLKESCIKANGKGLSIPLKAFSTISVSSKKYRHISTLEGKNYYLGTLKLDEEYMLSVCASRAWDLIPVKKIDQSDLFRTFLTNVAEEGF